jgi:hypothetical protein
MKKKLFTLFICLTAFCKSSDCQVTIIISLVKAAIVKVIQAIDLEVQKLQTRTIWLQNAQKTLENAMTELRLNDIADWVQKQKDLYQEYYNELWQVKQIVAGYEKVKSIIDLQSRIISEYRSASALFKQDRHFTAAELSYMDQVYAGILDESSRNIDQVLLVVNAFVTQMSDAARLSIIDDAARQMQKNYNDLKLFNTRNIQLSIQRSSDTGDLETVEKIYGLK